MTLALRKNRSMIPSVMSDLLDTGRFFTPDVFDLDTDLLNLTSGSVPSVNIIENPSDFKVELAAPGMDRKDFKIEIDNNSLTISGEKKEERKEDKENYRRREFSYNAFNRSFDLPENVIADKIDAKYENGILHLSLPKKEVTVLKPKKEIKIA
ncbi:MAG: hypothetical protein A3F72_05265 [Bacteroidetes bacterium RIFCSPLOWO2_12_FULL_35_15]|nr:MAG: hypothetical protein A3F72_05265 [Bacteroidetes bacterium RIFCSPLOWO2_12_FULL_35_15]